MADDRRRSARVEILGRLHGHAVSMDVAVQVKEISLGGMALVTPFPFPPATVHNFRLTLGDGSAVELCGKVIHCRAVSPRTEPETFLTGFEFVDDSATGADDVGSLLGKLR